MLHFEYIGEGLAVTVLGMSVVFALLFLISCILSLLGAAEKALYEKSIEENKFIAMKDKDVVCETIINEIDDRELVAVVTAAIAASLNTGTDGLVVRSLRRVNTWNKEAMQEQQNNIY